MPLLNWIGKDKVINHDKDLPFRVLKQIKELSVGDKTDNLLIEGDNLEALKALMPFYHNKIKCIYIDPPYNTGNEKWIYNDKVNAPQIKSWLNKIVGAEGEDLCRHDKWLCMMYPRLKLLNNLLSDDGAIFVSIDDNELHLLKIIMDEIFFNNYVATFVWKRRASSALADKLVSKDHEYILCYAKSLFMGFNGNIKDYGAYKNPDNDPEGEWTLGDLTVGMTKNQRPNQFYDLIDPKSGKVYKPNPQRVWAFFPESMQKEIAAGRVVFPITPNARPMYKRYKKNLKSKVNPLSTWIKDLSDKNNDPIVYEIQSGLNSEGTKELQKIFGEKLFDYPKPVSLIKNLIQQVTDKESIVLDSFAGSGTTGQAVLELNKEDQGNRRFILIELETDIARNVTAKRLIEAYNGYKGALYPEGTGQGFDYLDLNGELYDNSGQINKSATYEDMASYIYFTETRSYLDLKTIKKPFIGSMGSTHYFLFFNEQRKNILNDKLLVDLNQYSGTKVVYADKNLLDEDVCFKNNIVFKQIPYELKKF